MQSLHRIITGFLVCGDGQLSVSAGPTPARRTSPSFGKSAEYVLFGYFLGRQKVTPRRAFPSDRAKNKTKLRVETRNNNNKNTPHLDKKNGA